MPVSCPLEAGLAGGSHWGNILALGEYPRIVFFHLLRANAGPWLVSGSAIRPSFLFFSLFFLLSLFVERVSF